MYVLWSKILWLEEREWSKCNKIILKKWSFITKQLSTGLSDNINFVRCSNGSRNCCCHRTQFQKLYNVNHKELLLTMLLLLLLVLLLLIILNLEGLWMISFPVLIFFFHFWKEILLSFRVSIGESDTVDVKNLLCVDFVDLYNHLQVNVTNNCIYKHLLKQ